MANTKLSIEDVLSLVEPGVTVQIIHSNGRTDKGTVLEISASKLRVIEESSSTVIDYPEWLESLKTAQLNGQLVGVRVSDRDYFFQTSARQTQAEEGFYAWIRQYDVPTESVQEAFDLWIELTEVDPESQSIIIDFRRNLQVYQINRDLRESLELDESKFTTMILLDRFAQQYFDESTIRVSYIMNHYEDVSEFLGKAKRLFEILRSDVIMEYRKEFQERLTLALQHYGFIRDDVMKLAEDSYELCFLWRDALKAMDKLSVHQFLQGLPDTKPPVYFTKVHESWNVNSLLKSLCRTHRSGISLHLIREPNALFSYFAFGVRNGGTVSILTDKPSSAHPLQKYMSRRPGRDISERAFRFWFPYELLDMDFDYRGDAYLSHDAKYGLVPYQSVPRPLRSIADLDAREIVWIVFMFSLIEDKFFKRQYLTKELSYTGEMIKVGNALEDETKALAVTNYQTIDAPYMTSERASSVALKEDWGRTPVGHNEWVEERYEHLINDELLNLVDKPTQQQLFITQGNSLVEFPKTDRYSFESFEVSRKKKELGHLTSLERMDSTSFGTREEVLADQRWFARYNKAKLLNRELWNEFEATKDEVARWYENTVRNNLENLLDYVAHGELTVKTLRHPMSFTSGYDSDESNILLIQDKQGIGHTRVRWSQSHSSVLIDGGRDEHSSAGFYGRRCAINQTLATLRAIFHPTTPEALGLLCGCSVSELPDVLQHWTGDHPYYGNSILDRLDPLDWVIKNPWQEKMQFGVTIYLSKSGYNQARKERGLPPNRFWMTEEESE